MVDPTDNAFADVVARKLERDRLAAEKESAKVVLARRQEAEWQDQKTKFTSDLVEIKKVISKHAATLAAGMIRLSASMEGFDEGSREGRISVLAEEDGKKTRYAIHFNLRSGNLVPVVSIGHTGKAPSNAPLKSVDAKWYESAIRMMLEQAYPAAKA